MWFFVNKPEPHFSFKKLRFLLRISDFFCTFAPEMTQEGQKIIDTINRVSRWCVEGTVLIGLIVMFFYNDKPFWWTAGILLGTSLLVNAITYYWATDEEKIQRIEEYKEAIKQLEEERKSTQVNLHIDHLDNLHLGDNVEHKFTL